MVCMMSEQHDANSHIHHIYCWTPCYEHFSILKLMKGVLLLMAYLHHTVIIRKTDQITTVQNPYKNYFGVQQ